MVVPQRGVVRRNPSSDGMTMRGHLPVARTASGDGIADSLAMMRRSRNPYKDDNAWWMSRKFLVAAAGLCAVAALSFLSVTFHTKYYGNFMDSAPLVQPQAEQAQTQQQGSPKESAEENVETTSEAAMEEEASKAIRQLAENIERNAKIELPAGVTPRSYDPRPKDKEFHCVGPEPGMLEKEGQDLPKVKDGFLFIKTFKTGSSTASGINLRIAQNVASRMKKPFNICRSRFDHVRPLRVCPGRNKEKSYLWTIVREPAKRLISMFFHFGVTRNKFEANGANLLGYIRNETNFIEEYYLKYLSHKEYWFTDKKDDPVNVINGVVRDFDFIAVTERMDESLVALSMLMNVPLADVMYLPAKIKGKSYDDQPPCDKIQPSFITDDMQAVLDSEHFENLTKWDRVLYDAASKSLDLTIEKLGREDFERRLKLYRKAQKLAADRCLPKTIFPCSDGIWHEPNETHCVWKDSHCNPTCLNEVATEMKLWAS